MIAYPRERVTTGSSSQAMRERETKPGKGAGLGMRSLASSTLAFDSRSAAREPLSLHLLCQFISTGQFKALPTSFKAFNADQAKLAVE